MSREDSIFDELFGPGGPLEQIFGKGAKFVRMPPRGGMQRNKANDEKSKKPKGKKSRERSIYVESLFTELLTTLAGKKLITNDEARDVIAKAKERAKKKTEEADAEDKKAEEKAEENADKKAEEKSGPTHVHRVMDEAHVHAHDHDNPPCGGTCPDHDKRPHKTLDCARCKRPTAHLIEGDFGRCRF
jgi:hypothetical protein